MITKFNKFTNDFKFNYEFKNSIIFSNSKIEVSSDQPSDRSRVIDSDTRIGVVSGDTASIDMLIIITDDTKYYSPSGHLTDDSYVSIELEPGKYLDLHEPIDLMEEGDYEQYIEDDPESMVDIENKYKLDHFLIEM
jgi:hypothetical protein